MTSKLMSKRITSDGKDYEILAEKIFKKIYSKVKNASVKRDVSLDSEFGKRQFDVVVYDVYENYGVSIIIECKDHIGPIDVSYMDAYVGKLLDFNVKESFFIAKNGFTKNALKKASANGIHCCIAQEAFHSKWSIDKLINVYLTNIVFKSFNCKIRGLYRGPDAIYEPNIINKIDMVELFEKKWNKGEIDLSLKGDKAVVQFNELKAPYFIDFISDKGEVVNREIIDYNAVVTYQTTYYKTTLDQIKKTQLLTYCGEENAINIIIDMAEFSKYKSYMGEIEKGLMDTSKGIILLVTVKSNLKFPETPEIQVKRIK